MSPDESEESGPLIKAKGVKIVRSIFEEEWGGEVWDRAYGAACQELGIDKEESLKSEWHPLKLEMTFLRKLHEQNPDMDKDYNFVFDVGRKDGERAFSTAYKFLTKFMSMKNVFKTANIAWSQYFTRGVLSVEKEGESYISTLKNLELEHPYDYYLCGYFTQIAIMLGGDVKRSKHADLVWEDGDTRVVDDKLTKCTAEGDEEAVFVFEMDNG